MITFAGTVNSSTRATKVLFLGSASLLLAACSANHPSAAVPFDAGSFTDGPVACSSERTAASADPGLCMAARTLRSSACNRDRCQGQDGGFSVPDFALCPGTDAGAVDVVEGAQALPTSLLDTYDEQCEFRVRAAAFCGTDERTVNVQIGVTTAVGESAAVGGTPYATVYLTPTHPVRGNEAQTKELAPGWYELGPYRLDAPGAWTFEIHLFADCVLPGPGSPHVHLSLLLNVP